MNDILKFKEKNVKKERLFSGLNPLRVISLIGLVLLILSSPVMAGDDEITFTEELSPSIEAEAENEDTEEQTIVIEETGTTITADKESLIRNNDFTVTVTGPAEADYVVWVSGTDTYSNTSGYPPKFLPNQYKVTGISQSVLNSMEYNTGTTVAQDIPYAAYGTTNEWAVKAHTKSDGTITIGLTTDGLTKDATYTIRAEKYISDTQLDSQNYDTVKVKVEKGSVTVAAAGENPHFLGEEITLAGTNTDTNDVYLFMTGPNLPTNGGLLVAPQIPINITPVSAYYTHETVKTDNTWEYKWDTCGLSLDDGVYTIYAASNNVAKSGLLDVSYDTVSVEIKKPTLTATVSSPTVLKGNKLFIRGNATGNPTEGVAVWILGKNYWNGAATPIISSYLRTEAVNDDGSYEYELGTADTMNLAEGEYSVVVQHPMYNNKFDVYTSTGWTQVLVVNRLSSTPYSSDNSNFIIWGTGMLQSSDAIKALMASIDSPYIDDIYCNLTFTIEEPYINITPIEELYIDEIFTISGITNLAPGKYLNIKIAPLASADQVAALELSPVYSTVQVLKGDEVNCWSVDFDASEFEPDDYVFYIETIEAETTATADFTILNETEPEPTPAPTPGTSVNTGTITLNNGWNFISTPKRLETENNTAVKLFGNVNSAGHSALMYDASSGSWVTVKADTEIKPLNALWIYSNNTESQKIPLRFDSDPLQAPPSKELCSGWNTIGFTALNPATARDTLIDASGKWTKALGWNAENQSYDDSIISGGSGIYSDLRDMNPGKGYWVWIKEDCTVAALS